MSGDVHVRFRERLGVRFPRATRLERPQGFYVLLHPDEPGESERVFHRLAENGQIRVPLQKTFWSPCYGVLIDRFGVPWEISCEGHD